MFYQIDFGRGTEGIHLNFNDDSVHEWERSTADSNVLPTPALSALTS